MGEHEHCIKQAGLCVLASVQANSPARSIEMNIIIIAACIPTLRPIFLVLGKRPGAENFRASVRERGHSSYYYRSAATDGSKTLTGSSATSKAPDRKASRAMTGSTEAINHKDGVDGGDLIQVESRELGNRDGELEEGIWGHANDSGVPMTDWVGDRNAGNRDLGRLERDSEV